MSYTDIESYSKLAKAANFYLIESFKYLSTALKKDFRQLTLEKNLIGFEYSEEESQAMREFEENQDIISILQNGNKTIEALKSETLEKLLQKHKETDKEIQISKERFQKEHSVRSIEILGHINNYAFFIEILTNRHLLFLKHTQNISPFIYNQLSTAKIMNRLIFIFKEEIDNNTLQLNEITNLFKFRNKAVHYTPENAIALQVKISSLMKIWKQSIKLVEIFEKTENFKEGKFSYRIETEMDNFVDKWI